MNEKLRTEISRVIDMIWARQSLGRRKIRDGLITMIHGGTPIQFEGEDLFRFDIDLAGQRTFAYVQNGEDQQALAFEFELIEMGLDRPDQPIRYVTLPVGHHDGKAILILGTEL